MTIPIDLIFRYDPDRPKPFFVPHSPGEAAAYLAEGNARIARFYDACKRHGYPPGVAPSIIELSAEEVEEEPIGPDDLPRQLPFALTVGCADARVPAEILFGQEFNDIFNVRVAGNVLGPECVGSVLYALRTFVPHRPDDLNRNLRLVIALGHRGCGAVNATIATLLLDDDGDGPPPDDPVGAILRRIADPAMAIGVEAFDAAFGPGAALERHHQLDLAELVIHLNAAWVAHELSLWVHRQGEEIAQRVGVVWAVFDPADLRVRPRPPAMGEPPTGEIFAPPPRGLAELRDLAREIAGALHAARGGTRLA